MVTRAILVLAVMEQPVARVVTPETLEPVVTLEAMATPALEQHQAIPATLVQQAPPEQTVLVQLEVTPAQTEPQETPEPQAIRGPLVRTGLRVQTEPLVQAPFLVAITRLQAVRLVLVEQEEQVV